MSKKTTNSKPADFSDMTPQTAVGFLTNTAIVMRNSGHPVEVMQGTVAEYGACIFIVCRGYRMVAGSIVQAEGVAE